MRIGITNLFTGSAFSGSIPQVAIYIAHSLKDLGHDVQFLVPESSALWFVDCLDQKDIIPVVKMEQGVRIQKFDLLIEIAWFLPALARRELSTRSVMFYHYPPVFYDIESSTYPLSSQTREFENLDCIWTWSFHKKTDFEYLEILTGCPVIECPFTWNPSLVESYCKESNLSSHSGIIDEIFICETNESNTSSCTLPLTILSEILGKDSTVKWKVINGKPLIDRPFFSSNVTKNLQLGNDISGNFLKRIRLPDLLRDNSVILSHQRWRPLKYLHLDALYMGIPLIHNNELLRTVPGGQFFYTLNRISQAIECWNSIRRDTHSSLQTVRQAILSRWGPESSKVGMSVVLNKTITVQKPIQTKPARVRIAFFDMWVDFKNENNMFVDALRYHKCDFKVDQQDPNLIIFGPFGTSHQNERFRTCPKIFYTGENLPPRISTDVVLNVGFRRDIKEKYLRIPNWMLELNWFNSDTTVDTNPSPFALDLLNPSISERSKFCAFVASNPTCVERNTLFQILSRYKHVDSAGSVFTNMNKIPCGAGGSRGQNAKVEFYRNYKFVLACENSSSEGYVTEKILHAKLGGSVPIYWGDPTIVQEFNPKAFINVSNFKDYDALLTHIKKVDTSASLWEAYATEKLIPDDLLAEHRGLWSNFTDIINTISNGAINQPDKISPYKAEVIANNEPRIIVTACNSAFVPSAVHLIQSTTEDVYVYVWGVNDHEQKRLRDAGAKKVIVLDTSWNPGWDDFWNPAHYAWKAFVLYLSYHSFKKGTNILYMDSGVEILRNIDPVWSLIETNDIFLTHMPEHLQKIWCHPSFCSLLNMTPAEGEIPQICGYLIGLKAGGKYGSLFDELVNLAFKRDVISGHKWFAYSETCKGHRHDQSIITLLAHRANIKCYLQDDYSTHTSRSEAEHKQLYFYVHRGQGVPPAPIIATKTVPDDKLLGIDDCYVVNLAHRNDRLQKFKTHHPDLSTFTKQKLAVYGKNIKLTPEIAHLFRNNDFKWKKSVMGCALSHYELWKQLRDSTTAKRYLMLEDDVRFEHTFIPTWNSMVSNIPHDTDIIFLGGVLPPNKSVFHHLCEQVNTYFGRTRTHQIGNGPMRRYFHFCTYSYIITKSGATKLCSLIDQKGIFTSIDHMIVNHESLLNIYFTTPLLAGCIQDSDPAYINADFNNFNRVDTFDSEIWNNLDAFTPEEVSNASAQIQVVYFNDAQPQDCVESEWIEEIIQRRVAWISHVNPVNTHEPILVYYQHTTPIHIIEGWVNRHSGCKLFLLHLSDESCKADVSLYAHPSIQHVFRNYWRPEVSGLKVTHFPLGYHKGRGARGTDSPNLSVRKYDWGFAGAMDRPERRSMLQLLQTAHPNHVLHANPTWKSSENLSEVEYNVLMEQCRFVPCYNGFSNVESFRFYEALEQGSVPLVPLDKHHSYNNILGADAMILGLSDMNTVDRIMTKLSSNTDILDKFQQDLKAWWSLYKYKLRSRILTILFPTQKTA